MLQNRFICKKQIFLSHQLSMSGVARADFVEFIIHKNIQQQFQSFNIQNIPIFFFKCFIRRLFLLVNFKMENKYYLMNSYKELQAYSLTLLNVKMKVKFQCKMILEYDGNAITSEVVPQKQQFFQFNQSINLNQDPKTSCFVLSLCLLTQKGAKYTAAQAYLYYTELIRADGARLVISLSKCLDPEAQIEFKVNGITSLGEKRPFEVDTERRYTQVQGKQKEVVPRQRSKVSKHIYGQHVAGTRSEIHFPSAHIYKPHHAKQKMKNSKMSVYENEKTERERSRSRSRISRRKKVHTNANEMIQLSGQHRYIHELQDPVTQYAPLSGSREKYTDSYHKLKSKLKNQTMKNKNSLEKVHELENSQALQKMENVKLKIKCSQFQKMISEKNDDLRRLEKHLMQIKNDKSQSQVDRSLAKDNLIEMLENKILLVQKQMDELRMKTKNNNQNLQDREKQYKQEIQLSKIKHESSQQEKQSRLRTLQLKVNENNVKISENQNKLSQLKKDKAELENQLEKTKRQAFTEKQSLDESWGVKNKQLKQKIDSLLQQKQIIQKKNDELSSQLQKAKGFSIKVEYDSMASKKQLEKLESQLKQYKPYKEKYIKLASEHKKVQSQKAQLVKNHDYNIHLKETNINSINAKYQQEINNVNRNLRDTEVKLQSLESKCKEKQSTISSLKNELDSAKRMNDGLQLDNAKLKNNERHNQKEVGSLQHKNNLALSELQITKQKLRGVEGQLQNESHRLAAELMKAKNDLENEMMRTLEEKEKNAKLSNEINQSQAKFRFSEEKIQKENKGLLDKLGDAEKQILKYERENGKLTDQVTRLAERQQKLTHNIEQLGYENDQYQRIIQQLHRQINDCKVELKKLEEKYHQLSGESQLVNHTKNQLEKKLKQLESSYDNLTGENKIKSHKLEKAQEKCTLQEKSIQSLNQQCKSLENKLQSVQESLSDEVKNVNTLKQQLLRTQLNLENSCKQHERFKEYIYQTLQSSFSDVSIMQSNSSPKQMKASLGSADLEAMSAYQHKSPNRQSGEKQISTNDILNKIRGYSKECKGIITNLKEQVKILEKDKDKLEEGSQEITKKLRNEVEKAEVNIHQLQEELNMVCAEKQSRQEKMSLEIKSLYLKVSQNEAQINEMKIINQQNVFNINGLKMDKQSEQRYMQGILDDHKKKIKLLEQKNQTLEEKQQQLEFSIHNVEEDNKQFQDQLRISKEQCVKLNKLIKEYQGITQAKDKEIQQTKTIKKKLTAQVMELQMVVANQKQTIQKSNQLLTEQEKKLIESKEFINSLIKQKQTLVKSDLQKAEKIIELQSKVENLKEQLSTLWGSLTDRSQSLNTEKILSKKQIHHIKQLELQKANLLEKNKKLTQKVSEKQKQLKLISENLQINEEKYHKEVSIKNKQIKDLKNQVQILESNLVKEKELAQKQTTNLSEQLIEVQKQNGHLKKDKENLEKEINALKNSLSEKQNECQFIKNANMEQDRKIMSLQRKQQDLEEQVKDKQEQVFSISGKNYSLQNEIAQKHYKYESQIIRVDEDWTCKYEGMCEDYQNKLQQVEKERDYYQQKNVEAQQEVKKLSQTVKELENDETTERKLNSQKFKRLQEQKSIAIGNMKNELEKLNKHLKVVQASDKKKMLENESLQNTKKSQAEALERLEDKVKDYEKKLDELQKEHYSQLQQHSKKELHFKQFEENVNNCQWTMQREIRRQLQSFIKKIIGAIESEGEKGKIIDVMRDIESTIIKIVQNKMGEVKKR